MEFLFKKSIKEFNFEKFRSEIDNFLKEYNMKLITYDISFNDNSSEGNISISYISTEATNGKNNNDN